MTYGIPYQGSKSRIAEALIRVLPSGKRFVDLFGGGAAMTHIAALSGKYESVLYNDIQPNLVKLVQDAIAGKYNYDVFTPEFITRERFFAEKETDAYIKYLWSFSSHGKTYLFGKDIEEVKESMHNYVVFNIRDERLAHEFPNAILTKQGITARRLEWKNEMREKYSMRDDFSQLLQLQQLERLEQLEKLKIFYTCMDYREYRHIDGDVVYCDIPYEGTAEYDVDFNHEEFYEWANTRPYDVYVSSYSDFNDSRFTSVWGKTKRNLMKGTTTREVKVEALYVNHPIDFQFNNYEYVVQKQKEKQMTIFEVMK